MSGDFNPYQATSFEGDLNRPVGGDYSALCGVADGLKLILLSYLLLLGMFFVGMLFARNPAMLKYAAFGLGMAIGLLGLLGTVKCLEVPEAVRAKGLITVTIVCTCIQLVIAFLTLFGNIGENLLVSNTTQLCQIVGGICFLLFLKKVSAYIDRPDLAKGAQNILIINVLIAAAMLFFLVALVVSFPEILQMQSPQATINNNMNGLLMIAGFAMMIAGFMMIVSFILYILLLLKIRRQIVQGS